MAQPVTATSNFVNLKTLKLVSVNVDDQGDSYFSEVEAADAPSATGRAEERNFPLTAWQLWETKPGFSRDFQPVHEPQALSVMAGRLEITTSLGEKRYFSRGDTFLLQDIAGKGHAIRTIGKDTASVMLMTLKGVMSEKKA